MKGEGGGRRERENQTCVAVQSNFGLGERRVIKDALRLSKISANSPTGTVSFQFSKESRIYSTLLKPKVDCSCAGGRRGKSTKQGQKKTNLFEQTLLSTRCEEKSAGEFQEREKEKRKKKNKKKLLFLWNEQNCQVAWYSRPQIYTAL